MNPTEIEFAVRDLVAQPYDAETFPYDLIGILNASKMTVSRLKSGTTNKATQPGDVLWQKHFFFRPAQSGDDVGAIGDSVLADPLTARHKPRFILVTNGQQVHIRDVKFEETANVEFERLDEQSYFLIPLAGYERRAIVEEHPADIKAAKKLKKLYDAILAANPTWNSGHHSHELNLLMTRLLFCFYAEDTAIFDTPQIFTSTLTQHTSEDGNDVAPLLDRLFRNMNIEDAARPHSTSAVDAKFPYVNGSLFEDTVDIPQFSRTARRQLLECGDLDWTTINPDIFGSMIQTIAQDGTRSDLGMHYTSVPNIMKVLQPLFLDELHDAYTKAKDSIAKLEALLGRLSDIRIFDPTCGSGNFLIIAYKEMRKLELAILQRIADVSPKTPLRLSGISLNHFYGADVVDFSCETAKLSLWIAEHQMNAAFRSVFGNARPTLPLARISTIYSGNSLRLDWEEFCVPDSRLEIFLCGNPPYAGSKEQSRAQKDDVDLVFAPYTTKYRRIDYVACWLVKASKYLSLSNGIRAGFVTTNSLCQGEHVEILWPIIFSNDARIRFARTSFKWSNNASHNAGVTCIVVGLEHARASGPTKLFSGESERVVEQIGPYLVPGTKVIAEKSSLPLNSLPPITTGNEPGDGGFLILNRVEREQILKAHPLADRLIRRYIGSRDFLNDGERWCLWLDDSNLQFALTIKPIQDRLQRVAKARLTSGSSAVLWARTPHLFGRVTNLDKAGLVIPKVSSEHRRYLQIGLVDALSIVNNTLRIAYDPPAFLLAVLSSRLHYIWTETVGGRMRTDLQYSTTIVYNAFPIPALSDEQKKTLAEYSGLILKTRAKFPGKTLAWLYNPESMPAELVAIHRQNDAFFEERIFGRRFEDDNQRLELLFKMYERIRTGGRVSLLGAAG